MGDGIYIEPDILHGCVCLEPGVLIDCFAPMRADFFEISLEKMLCTICFSCNTS